MDYKLRGTNVIAIELLTDDSNFNVEDIKRFVLEKRQLLKGSRLILSVENYKLKETEIEELLNRFKSLDEITFCGFKTNLKENRELCIKMGIPCDLSSLEIEKVKERSENEEIKFIKKTLRSGDKITSTGDVIIMGDVNPGAEVEAGGNVYVIGNLMGFVKAGIGKKECEVRALYFKAPIIEVCGKQVPFERAESFTNFKIKVKDGRIKIEHKTGRS